MTNGQILMHMMALAPRSEPQATQPQDRNSGRQGQRLSESQPKEKPHRPHQGQARFGRLTHLIVAGVGSPAAVGGLRATGRTVAVGRGVHVALRARAHRLVQQAVQLVRLQQSTSHTCSGHYPHAEHWQNDAQKLRGEFKS